MSRRLLFLYLLLLMMVLILVGRGVEDSDVHWQIRTGQLMLQEGRLVETERFTFTHSGQEVPTFGWLLQLVYAVLYQWGGWWLLHSAGALLFAGALVLVAWTAMRRGDQEGQTPSLLSVGIALQLCFFAAMSTDSLRPQSVALACWAVSNYLIQQSRSWWRTAVLLIPCGLVWQNSHPSIVLGVAWVGLLAVGQWVDRRDHRWLFRQLGWAAVLAVLQFATPMGFSIWEAAATNVTISREVLGQPEWLPAWDELVRWRIPGFWLALMVTIWLLVRVGRRVSRGEWLVFVLMTLLPLYSARLVLFWAVIMLPCWIRWFERERPPLKYYWPGIQRLKSPLLVQISGVAVGLAAALLVSWEVRSRWSAPTPLLQEALRRLAAELPAGRIYNFHAWGGPLILAGSPQWQVYIDGRLYLYQEAEWRHYRRINQGRVVLAEVVEELQPDAFVLHPRLQRGLVAQLQEAADWQLIYQDAEVVIYIRRTSITP
ncbi:MAG: hypothetical protein HJJLKODD_00115 [Phycisphaerae bacterium]|nr:hypothetical protein [Phycisphaerae bacterium]